MTGNDGSKLGSDNIFTHNNRRGCDVGFIEKEPAVPTQVQPGTKHKVAIMALRVESGECAFSDDDFRCTDELRRREYE